MKCCAKCVGDIGLTKVFPSFSSTVGDCDYCEEKHELIAEPKVLNDFFAPLIRIYEPRDEGKLLVEWLRDDWGMFEHERMDNARAATLLAEILDDGEIVRRKFAPSLDFATESLKRWEALREELMFGNRYFPKVKIEKQRLEELLELLLLPEGVAPYDWYRARLMQEDQVYTIDEMGPPPRNFATHGRANPAGIPYLYLCSERTNAVSEIRPHTGEKVCIAIFNMVYQLKLIDLRSPKHSISPLDFGDEERIGYLRSDLGFLSRLGDELTRPVKPRSAAVDYVPSQYLCEFIKNCGYDGVVYRSSVGKGINLALFDKNLAQGRSVSHHVVGKIEVSIN